MKFNLWTFFFQVVNFFVLLYILKKVLYKPIREIIEKRRSLVQKTVDDAEKMKKEAQELKEQNRQEADWLNDLKSGLLEKAQEEAEEYRAKLMHKAKVDADGVIEKETALFEAEKRRTEAELKNMAAEMVSAYASRLMKDISDPDLHRALCSRFLKDIVTAAPRLAKMKKESGPLTIELVTAYPLDEVQMSELRKRIESLVSSAININSTVDKDLFAGVKIKVADMVYDASLSGQIETLRSKLKEVS
jgi:F-type H+-transporting ATPase subunit b